MNIEGFLRFPRRYFCITSRGISGEISGKSYWRNPIGYLRAISGEIKKKEQIH